MADPGWQYGRNGAAVCAENTINTNVFRRFHLSSFFMILRSPGLLWDLIFCDVGDSWSTILVTWGSQRAPGRTLWGLVLDFYRFVVDFDELLGPNFSDVFVICSDLGR